MRLTALALALLSVPAIAGDLVARDREGNSIRLTGEACPDSILALLPVEFHDKVRAGSMQLGGRGYLHCWALRPDGAVVMQVDDGGVVVVPLGAFKAEPGV